MCQFSGDGECDDGVGSGIANCPIGTDEDCPSRVAVESEPCGYLFVFDFTDEVLIPPTCTTTGGNAPDGSTCVLPFTYNGVQYNECTSIDEPAPWCNVDADQEDGFSWGFCVCPAFSIPARNVYDCTEVVSGGFVLFFATVFS
jgi:hypothetical protein